MSKRKPIGKQIDAIPRSASPFQVSFDLKRQDQFVTSLGIDFIHYKAMPSPIGMKDRGDYRRSDVLDTVSSNGMIYTKSGCFTATMTDNSKSEGRDDGGFIDTSTSRLVLPRFYNQGGEVANGKRIYMAPGDRVYAADPDADTRVPNYHRMEYDPVRDNVPMFPICEIELLQDSRGISHIDGVDFVVTSEGNIRWLASGNNPGIYPDTGKGRVFAIRYQYKAYWYIVAIPKEVRITNVTGDDGIRKPERMAQYVMIQREYIYHSTNNGNKQSELKPQDQKRIRQDPAQNLSPKPGSVAVDMSDIEQES